MNVQYERIRPVVFQKAPEVKQVRSNSLAVRSSPSKQSINQSFDHHLMVNTNTSNVQDLQNLRKMFVSESCNNNKENISQKKFSFKVDDIQYLKSRIQQLEQQNANYMTENKKLAHVLDQQIQLNQSLQEQHYQKQQLIKKLEDQGRLDDVKQNNDQLSVYKKVVNDLESKIQLVIEENTKLNEINERFMLQECNFKSEIEKYKNRCQFLEERLKNQQVSIDDKSHHDLQRKCKRLSDEVHQLKEQLSKSTNSSHQQTINELECENRYMQQVMQIDQQKMCNLEEKLNLLSKENQRLQDIVKSRHK
ncbi:hypothetical protein pb186bvf_014693 [Paramecium bursaria]